MVERVVIIGSGIRGMVAGVRMLRDRPDCEVIVAEALPYPGNDARTQRSNGFACELGTFAWSEGELQPAFDVLPRSPRILPVEEHALRGWTFDGKNAHAVDVACTPCSFANGCEDLVQALRRQLGDALRLGRAVTAIHPDGDGFTVDLGGQVTTQLSASEVVLATSPTNSALLLAAFDPKLAEVAANATRERRAFVFFGGLTKDTSNLEGYGMLAQPELDSPLVELIYCTNVFGQRAMNDRFLMRAELVGDDLPTSEPELVAIAEAEMRRWTKTDAPFGFSKAHPFTVGRHDDIELECRTRITELVRSTDGLSLAN